MDSIAVDWRDSLAGMKLWQIFRCGFFYANGQGYHGNLACMYFTNSAPRTMYGFIGRVESESPKLNPLDINSGIELMKHQFGRDGFEVLHISEYCILVEVL